MESTAYQEFLFGELFPGSKDIMLAQIDSGISRIRKEWREEACPTGKIEDMSFVPQELTLDDILLRSKICLNDLAEGIEDGGVIDDAME